MASPLPARVLAGCKEGAVRSSWRRGSGARVWYVGNVAEYNREDSRRRRADAVSGKTFYLGDSPADIKLWASAFTVALTGRPLRVGPSARPARNCAHRGYCQAYWDGRFHWFTSRYRSMTQSYLVDMTRPLRSWEARKYSLEDGVKETVEWLKSLGGIWNKLNRLSNGRTALKARS